MNYRVIFKIVIVFVIVFVFFTWGTGGYMLNNGKWKWTLSGRTLVGGRWVKQKDGIARWVED